MRQNLQKKSPAIDAVMRYARRLGFGDIHHVVCTKTQLNAIIAVHDTTLGPAIGGCRFYNYPNYTNALTDALRLSSMMTFKNAACGLAHGGGKTVVQVPRGPYCRQALFERLGDFIQNINGRYITAMDVGTTNKDMDAIARRTPHVIGASQSDPLQSDPSPFTARGVFRGIQAAVKTVWQTDTLENLTVAIQGVGKVGHHLARQLYALGAKIIVCDTNTEATDQLADECDATIVAPDQIMQVNCDIFSPCAFGGSINQQAVRQLTAKVIAGCANNQLAHRNVGRTLHERGILYAPDFMINAGGVIQAASIHDYHDIAVANKKIDCLYDHLIEVFERAQHENIPTTEVGYQIAFERLSHAQQEAQ